MTRKLAVPSGTEPGGTNAAAIWARCPVTLAFRIPVAMSGGSRMGAAAYADPIETETTCTMEGSKSSDACTPLMATVASWTTCTAKVWSRLTATLEGSILSEAPAAAVVTLATAVARAIATTGPRAMVRLLSTQPLPRATDSTHPDHRVSRLAED